MRFGFFPAGKNFSENVLYFSEDKDWQIGEGDDVTGFPDFESLSSNPGLEILFRVSPEVMKRLVMLAPQALMCGDGGEKMTSRF